MKTLARNLAKHCPLSTALCRWPLVLSLAMSVSLRAQVRFVPWPQKQLAVSSYLGTETAADFNDFRFVVDGADAQYANWSLSVRLMSPIVAVGGGTNRCGKPFPADRISFRQTADTDSPHPGRLHFIETGRDQVFLQEAGEVFLIRRANVPIPPRGGAEFNFFGSVEIAPGEYLDDYLSGDRCSPIKYAVPLVFTLYDEHMRVIAALPSNYQLVLQPLLTDGRLVDLPPDYSIEVEAVAQNAKLVFRSLRDYEDGVTVMLDDAVKVRAATEYEIRIKALDAAFTDGLGNSLPLSSLSVTFLQGSPNSHFVYANPPTRLSTTEKTALWARSSNKKKAQYYHLRYWAKMPESGRDTFKLGNYSASLLYQIMPR